MDHRRFDALTRSVAAPRTRRGFLGGLAALGAGLLAGRGADAQQVTQAYCGNVTCKTNPGKCKPGCVCCVWSNGNNRCVPPGVCNAGGVVIGGTTTAAPTTTTTTTSTTATPCVPLTPPYTPPVAPCLTSSECCGGGTCCTFDSDLGSACFDLQSNFAACGTTCETSVNCANVPNATACVNGVCTGA